MFAFLLLLPCADAEPTGKAEIKLEFSHPRFAPLKPGKETVKAVLVNNTGKPIKVPARLDNGALRLVAPAEKAAGIRFEMTLFVRDRREAEWAEVKAGARRVLFELALADILPSKREPKAMYGWDWPARMMSPPSPAHGSKGEVAHGKIRLKAVLNGMGVKAESPAAELEIVPAGK